MANIPRFSKVALELKALQYAEQERTLPTRIARLEVIKHKTARERTDLARLRSVVRTRKRIDSRSIHAHYAAGLQHAYSDKRTVREFLSFSMSAKNALIDQALALHRDYVAGGNVALGEAFNPYIFYHTDPLA